MRSNFSSDQEFLAVRFAQEDPSKFRDLAYRTGGTGAPLLEDVPAWLDCTVVREVAAGDHTVFIGRVEEARKQAEEPWRPLVYHLGRYGTLEGEPGEP